MASRARQASFKRPITWAGAILIACLVVNSVLIKFWGGYTPAHQFIETNTRLLDRFGTIKHKFLWSFNIKNNHGRMSFFIIGNRDWGFVPVQAKRKYQTWVIALIDEPSSTQTAD